MLSNQTIAITGAVGRLGSVFSKAIVKNNGNVLLGDVKENEGKSLVKELGEQKAYFIKANLTESDEIEFFFNNDIYIKKAVLNIPLNRYSDYHIKFPASTPF